MCLSIHSLANREKGYLPKKKKQRKGFLLARLHNKNMFDDIFHNNCQNHDQNCCHVPASWIHDGPTFKFSTRETPRDVHMAVHVSKQLKRSTFIIRIKFCYETLAEHMVSNALWLYVIFYSLAYNSLHFTCNWISN